VDYYVKNTRDLLNTVQLPTGFGFTHTLQNVGQIRNKGVEIAADAALIDKGFKWKVGGNIAFNRNRVVKLYGGQDILGGGIAVSIITDATNLLREGQPMAGRPRHQVGRRGGAGRSVFYPRPVRPGP